MCEGRLGKEPARHALRNGFRHLVQFQTLSKKTPDPFYSICAGTALIFGAGYFKGREDVQESWDAAVTVQATRSASQIVAEAVNSATAEARYIEVKGETKTRLKIVERKVVEYVRSPQQKCAVDADFVQHFDAYSGVYNAGLPRLPASDPATEGVDELPGGGATTAELLQAYHAAIEQATGYRDAYHALAQFEEGRYIVQKAAQQEEP